MENKKRSFRMGGCPFPSDRPIIRGLPNVQTLLPGKRPQYREIHSLGIIHEGPLNGCQQDGKAHQNK